MAKVNVAVPLPALPVVTAVAVSRRSACVRTVPHDWLELFDDVRSCVVVAMVAELHRLAPSGDAAVGRTVMPNVALAPVASVAREHVTFAGPADPTAGVVHDHPAVGENERKVTPAGMASVIVTLFASLGPLFAATIE